MIPPALRTFAQLAQQIADDCDYILQEIKEICGLAERLHVDTFKQLELVA
jgi:hypothetical protein